MKQASEQASKQVTKMYLYRLTFKPGGKRITFHPIKNIQTGAHIASVIRSNFPYLKNFLVYDDNDNIVNNNDCISNECTYYVRRGSVVTLSRTIQRRHPVKKKGRKKYWYR